MITTAPSSQSRAAHLDAECPVCGAGVHVVLSTETLVARWTCLSCGNYSAAPVGVKEDEETRAIVPGIQA